MFDLTSHTHTLVTHQYRFNLLISRLHIFFPQMKRRNLILPSFRRVLYKVWTRLALIWTPLPSSWMPLVPSLITAAMPKHSLTSWWLVGCWVRNRTSWFGDVVALIPNKSLFNLSKALLVFPKHCPLVELGSYSMFTLFWLFKQFHVFHVWQI